MTLPDAGATGPGGWLVAVAAERKGAIAGDLVPLHTGLGPPGVGERILSCEPGAAAAAPGVAITGCAFGRMTRDRFPGLHR